MSEMIKISVTNYKLNKKFVAMMAKKVFENVSFGSMKFHDKEWDGCKFVNCVFDKMAPKYCEYIARKYCVFENCTFCNDGAFMEGHMCRCKFIGCKFENCRLNATFSVCEFADCKFDHVNFYDNLFEKCSFKRCKAKFCDFNSLRCVNCVGKMFIRVLSPMACPEKGEYEAWKQCFCLGNGKSVYAKLLIPADAKRSSAHGLKCRASKAKVLGFYNADGKRLPLKKARSWWNENFIYTVGETVKPLRPFNPNRYEECTSGIHHFMTLEDAVGWRT